MEHVIIRNSNNNELYHHGVKGMKWGVRRYQDKNGSLTPAGKKRASQGGETNGKKKTNKKKVANMAIMTATVATAAAVYGANPAVRKTVNRFIVSAGKKTVSSLQTGSKKTVNAGKKYVKEIVNSAKAGVKEGVKEAPKKATKAIVTGITLNTAKRMMDKAVGKEETARIFKANNGKKIDSFWKVAMEDRDDD